MRGIGLGFVFGVGALALVGFQQGLQPANGAQAATGTTASGGLSGGLSAAVDMSWPQSAGFLKIVPITPSLGAGFRSLEWGTLFGPNLDLADPAAVAAWPMTPGAAASSAASSATPASPATSGSPATPASLGTAVPGSAPTQPVGPAHDAGGNKLPGDWGTDTSDSGKVHVTIVHDTGGQSTTGGAATAGEATGSTSGASTAGEATGSTSGAATAGEATVATAGATTAGASMAATTGASYPSTGVVTPSAAAPGGQAGSRIAGGYVSWTPGVIYVAGIVPQGQDLVVSIDSKATGQPFGATDADFEVRIPGGSGTPVVRQASGGALKELTAWGSLIKTAVAPDPDMPGFEVVQAAIVDPSSAYFPTKVGSQFAIRLDAVTPGQVTTLGTKRALSLVEVSQSKGPNGAADASGPAYPGLSVNGSTQFTAGLAPSLNLVPKGNWPGSVGKVSVDPVGVDASSLGAMSLTPGAGFEGTTQPIPYPVFVGKTITPGYGAFIVRLTNGTTLPTTYYLPYRVVEPISIESQSAVLHSVDAPQKVKIQANLISNVRAAIHGVFSVNVPPNWEVDKGTDKSFVLYNINNKSVRDLVVTVPSSVPPGLYPITLSAAFGQQAVTKTVYVVVM